MGVEMDLTLPSTVDSCNHGSGQVAYGVLDLLVPFYVPLLLIIVLESSMHSFFLSLLLLLDYFVAQAIVNFIII